MKKGLGYYNYTVILTYVGMLFGFNGILKSIDRLYNPAIIFLMAAGLCDMFDGTIAATRERTRDEKNFGIQIDSLSDLICFGVLPGVFIYMVCGQSRFPGAICALYVLCALIRLSYFNVDEEKRQLKTTKKREFYLGLPVTTVAIVLPVLYFMYHHHVFKTTRCFIIAAIIMAIGFLSPIEIKKFNFS